MNTTTIDLEILETGDGKNPFDELISSVEKLNLQGKLDVRKEDLEKTILFLERKYQDFSDFDAKKSMIIFQAINANLMIFNSQEHQSFIKISENLNRLKHITLDIDVAPNIDYSKYLVSSNIATNFNSQDKNDFSLLQSALENIYETTKKSVEKDQWIIELNFDVDVENRHKSLEFIHFFIESLNTLKGVKVTLEDIKVGSIKVKLKIQFDDESSKSEVKDILESSRLLAKQKLEKKHVIETTLIDSNDNPEILKKLEDSKYEETSELEMLQAEMLRQDIDRKKLENEEKRLNLLKERRIILRELISEGFLDQNDFEVLINAIPFLKIKNNVITIGESIDIIDKL